MGPKPWVFSPKSTWRLATNILWDHGDHGNGKWDTKTKKQNYIDYPTFRLPTIEYNIVDTSFGDPGWWGEANMLTYSPPTLTHWLRGPCGIGLGPGQEIDTYPRWDQGRLMLCLKMYYVFDAHLKLMNAALQVRALGSYPMVYKVGVHY